MQTLLDYTQPLIHLFVRTNSFPIFLSISAEISCTKNCCFRPTPTLPVPVHSMTIESVYGTTVLPFERNSFIQGYISWTLLPAESSFGKLSAASFSKPGVTSWIEPNSFPVAFLPWQHCLLALSIIRCPRTVAVMSKTDVFRNEIASELSVFFFFDLYIKTNSYTVIQLTRQVPGRAHAVEWTFCKPVDPLTTFGRHVTLVWFFIDFASLWKLFVELKR